MKLHRSIPFALLVALMPGVPAFAARIVPGFTEARSGERGEVNVNLVLEGPVEGPLKVGVLKRKRLSSAKTIELMAVPKGAFANIGAKLRLGRSPAGTYVIGVEGPQGLIGQTTVVMKAGAKRESFSGRKTKVVQTYYQQRSADLGRAFLDSMGVDLSLIFFLKLDNKDQPYTVDFKLGKERICGDELSPVGARGQVIKTQAYCRLGDPKAAEEDQGGGVVFDDPNKVISLGGGDKDKKTAKADAKDGGSVGKEDSITGILSLEEALKRPGHWRVEVREGKRLKRVIHFTVAKGKFKGAAGRAPLMPLKVKVVSP